MFFRKRPPHPDSVDMSSKRSIEIRERTKDRFVVDYFYHEGEFWTASIPLAVQDIYGQAFNFSALRTRRVKNGNELVVCEEGRPIPRFTFINHLQSRFQTKPGHAIELYPLKNEVDGAPTHRLYDFVYSVEATGPPGTAFDFRNGMAGTLLCMHRFLSTQEMTFERVVIQERFVWESASLPITDEEKRLVLVNSLERSHRSGVTEVYYLYRCCATNNCTSNPFQIVDESVQYNFWQWLGSILYRFPLSPRLYLWMRGLDADPTHYKLVRDDFKPYIEHPATQKRKQELLKTVSDDDA